VAETGLPKDRAGFPQARAGGRGVPFAAGQVAQATQSRMVRCDVLIRAGATDRTDRRGACVVCAERCRRAGRVVRHSNRTCNSQDAIGRIPKRELLDHPAERMGPILARPLEYGTDGSGVTQPVSIAATVVVSSTGTVPVSGTVSLNGGSPLPTGTNSIGQVTANAGTNLNTSLLALEAGGNLATVKTNTDNLALAQASTTSGQLGNLNLAAAVNGAPSLTTAKSYPLSMDLAGNLRVVNTTSGTVTVAFGSTPTVSTTGTVPVSIAGTVAVSTGTVAISPLTNSSIVKAQLQDNAGTAIVLGQTTMSASVPVALASNQSALSVSSTGTVPVVFVSTPTVSTTGTVPVVFSGTASVSTGTIALVANQSMNTAQVGGNTIAIGNGVSATGVARVAIISDQTAFNVNSNSANIATEASLAKLPLAQGSTTSGQSGTLMQGAATTAAPTYTTPKLPKSHFSSVS